MSKPSHLHPADLRGLSRLTITATTGVTDLVEALHHTISRRPGILGAPGSGRTRGITGLVYR
ncbi:MAG: alpha/beta hydrolase, partial [Thermoanaerobaculia bacterium]|nr:alpha/beta hydrolase [Thermoanaerobaculia bacterium]